MPKKKLIESAFGFLKLGVILFVALSLLAGGIQRKNRDVIIAIERLLGDSETTNKGNHKDTQHAKATDKEVK